MKTHNLTSIPFHELTLALAAYSAEVGSEQLALRLASHIPTFTQSAEVGSDGLAEDYSESSNFTPSISQKQLDAITKSFIEAYDLGNEYTWFLPQAAAFLGGFKVQPANITCGAYMAPSTLGAEPDTTAQIRSGRVSSETETDEVAQVRSGRVSATATWAYILANPTLSSFWFDSKEGTRIKVLDINSNQGYMNWCKGLRTVLNAPRGLLLPSGTKAPKVYQLPRVCHLVPLILAAFKEFQGVPYSAWDLPDLNIFLDTSLAKAMLNTEHLPAFDDPDQLIETRSLALVYGGKLLNPTTAYSLTRSTSCLKGVPPLAANMLTQTWCAHPSNRGPYMILNPFNWDIVPEPLVSDEVFKTTKPSKVISTNYMFKPKSANTQDNIPWDT